MTPHTETLRDIPHVPDQAADGPPSARLCLDPDGLAYDLVADIPEGLRIWRRGAGYALTYALPAGGCILLADLDAETARSRVTRFLGRDPGPLSDWRA